MTPTLGKLEAQVVGCWCVYLPAAVLVTGAGAVLYLLSEAVGQSTIPGVLALVAAAVLALVALGAWLAVLGVGVAWLLAPRRGASRPAPTPKPPPG